MNATGQDHACNDKTYLSNFGMLNRLQLDWLELQEPLLHVLQVELTVLACLAHELGQTTEVFLILGLSYISGKRTVRRQSKLNLVINPDCL